MKKQILILFVLASGMFLKLGAQCDTIANICARHIIATYVSDGQQYRSLLLNSEEYAEFHTTFFGETIYRIAACSGTSDGNLIFNIYDQDRHLLFSNRNQRNAPYWDFKVKSTLEAIIEAQLDVNRNSGSGCAVILIGFKQK
ncbi:MAG TPA: hypothetical protein PLQ93_11880 [Bacteroidia bacterium]|nr:hypothetical protein [Bacteroidia bacterium]